MLTTPKRYGGLGVRDARITNIALLGKLVWNMAVSSNKTWVRILEHKYLRNSSIFGCSDSKGVSYVWRSILKALNAIREGWAFKIYDGSSSFWHDDWVDQGPLCPVVSFVHISYSQLKVSDVWQGDNWNLGSLATWILSQLDQILRNVEGPFNPLFLDGIGEA